MAGGKGTRLHKITGDKISKVLTPIAGKPIIQHQIERLRENGITEIIVCVGHLKESIKDFLGTGTGFNVNITYIEEDEPLGTAGCLYYLKERIKGDFLIAYGDQIFDINIERMINFHKEKNSSVTMFARPSVHPMDADLIICDEQGRVSGFLRKNESRDGWWRNLANNAFFVMNSHVLESIDAPKKLDMEHDFVTKLIQSGERVFAYVSSEYNDDTGTPERLAKAEADFQSGVIAARNLKNKQKCIFLDRDGVINVHNGYCTTPEKFILHQGAGEAIKMINQSEYLAIVVTNQGKISRGWCTEETLREIHNKMETQLSKHGAYVDAIYYCPHHPKGTIKELAIDCECRKPKAGMFLKAAEKFNINFSKSWLIGDSSTDIIAGQAVGVKTIKLPATEAKSDVPRCHPDYICENLIEAVKIIIG